MTITPSHWLALSAGLLIGWLVGVKDVGTLEIQVAGLRVIATTYAEALRTQEGR